MNEFETECSYCGNMFDPENEGVEHTEDRTMQNWKEISQLLYPSYAPKELKKILLNTSFCSPECEVQYLRNK